MIFWAAFFSKKGRFLRHLARDSVFFAGFYAFFRLFFLENQNRSGKKVEKMTGFLYNTFMYAEICKSF